MNLENKNHENKSFIGQFFYSFYGLSFSFFGKFFYDLMKNKK